MPSSTSSSSAVTPSPAAASTSATRAPAGRWGLTWLLALVMLAAALGVWKWYWTSQGFGVSVPNDLAAWAGTRTMLRDDSTVFLGSSRIQAAMKPAAWKEETGSTPLQLALVAATPLPVLRHLAEDTQFRGLAVVGIVEMYIFNVSPGVRRGDLAVAEYNALMTSPSRRAGVLLDRLVPYSLLVRNTRLDLPRILEATWEGHAPENPPGNMQRDRWMEFVGERVDLAGFDYADADTSGRPATPAERDSLITMMDGYVREIQSRGGRVALVAFPACGERREIEARRYPREMYWEPLAAATSADMVINAYDVPTLQEFRCTDGSHLDPVDADRFTRVIAEMTRPLQPGGAGGNERPASGP